jgi:hypothetical protein
MAIKRLMGCTEIADATQYRSLTDVERHLQQIKDQLNDADALLRTYRLQFARAETSAIKFTVGQDIDGPKKGGKIITNQIDKVVIPKMDALRSNFEVVNQLAEKVQELETMYASVEINFRGVRGQPDVLKSIKTMKAGAEKKLQDALDFLNDIGTKYAPTAFKEMTKKVAARLNEDLDFEKAKSAVYATEMATGELSFTLYIELKNLSDENGETWPKFYIVLTCVLVPIATDKTKLSVETYVTVMHDFQPPGRFDAGKRVTTDKEALAEIGHLLSLENIATAIGTLPHNLVGIDKKFLKTGAERVRDVEVDESSFTFWFLKAVKEAEARSLMNTLYPQVKAMLSHIKRAQVKMRLLEASDGGWGAKYSLVNLARDDQISVQDLDWLKKQFKMSDEKLREVVKIVNKGN